MIRVKEGDLNLLARSQFELCRRVQRKRLQDALQPFVGLHPSLENAFGEVDAAGIALQPEKNFSCCRRAVDKGREKALQPCEVVAVDMAEKAGEGCRVVRRAPEEVDYAGVSPPSYTKEYCCPKFAIDVTRTSNIWKLADDAVKGGHLGRIWLTGRPRRHASRRMKICPRMKAG